MFAAERRHSHLKQRGIVFNHLQKALSTRDSLVYGELVHPLRVANQQTGHKFQAGFLYATNLSSKRPI